MQKIYIAILLWIVVHIIIYIFNSYVASLILIGIIGVIGCAIVITFIVVLYRELGDF
jgi:hypothetical protein